MRQHSEVKQTPQSLVSKSDLRDARAEPRIEVWVQGVTLRESGCSAASVKVHDLSQHGFRTEWPYLLAQGSRVWLKLPDFEAWAAIVAWNRNFEVGCRFETPLHPAVFDRIIQAHVARWPQK